MDFNKFYIWLINYMHFRYNKNNINLMKFKTKMNKVIINKNHSIKNYFWI